MQSIMTQLQNQLLVRSHAEPHQHNIVYESKGRCLIRSHAWGSLVLATARLAATSTAVA